MEINFSEINRSDHTSGDSMYEFILYKKGEMVSLVDRNLISLKLMSECDPEEFELR
jgi:hypothetical protein